jgi:hypothetical protein
MNRDSIHRDGGYAGSDTTNTIGWANLLSKWSLTGQYSALSRVPSTHGFDHMEILSSVVVTIPRDSSNND